MVGERDTPVNRGSPLPPNFLDKGALIYRQWEEVFNPPRPANGHSLVEERIYGNDFRGRSSFP
jgi:hypothetical protein